jgi:adenosine kinase
MTLLAGGSGRALICGSMAYDTIMVFQDRFANHILPDKIHMLNVSFLVPQMRREFGGCAGNIAYNLRLLGDTGVPMAAVGSDFAPYQEWLRGAQVPTEHLRVIDSELTAQAFITTDLDDNQITAFHPGAMQHSHVNRVSEARDIAVGIVAPDGRQGMLEHAAQFAAAGIPFIFDPGQGLPLFGGEDLQRFISQARWVTLNEYEWQLVQQKTGWNVGEITARAEALIVTRGAAGASIYTRGAELTIAAAPVQAVVDPTGCGDAFRAGLLHGLLHGLDWRRTGHIAALMGAIKIESRGTQNHHFDAAGFSRRLAAAFS